ncbi:M28 family peptidase [Alteromonas sp. a30]|uniref:M28 family peptidase n=1 Tax=Alteromonas sp. a30 TaxID=2730917 RepID=UPI0022832198|nr:M28 family peptidase [Alteromonas sp. a30]MCY7294882.1 M28 family peptidase [Alteromonas sp. a30]
MNYLVRFALLTGLSSLLIVLASGFYSVPQSDVEAFVSAKGYSTDNVRQHLSVIARAPHPTGSAEIKRVRDYLVNSLRSLGAQTEVQQADVQKNVFGKPFMAHVENVLGFFPSSHTEKPTRNPAETRPLLVLMGHYDSFSQSHGANDNGHAVATILETMRVIQAQGGAKNDILVLFTDAEEQGTLGITAFMEQHPKAQNIGLVINFEARGSKGPLRLFETSSNNSALIQAFAQAAPFPIADSFFYSLYQVMGNYTDMTVSLAHGVQGINLAYSDGFYHYHTLGDSIENVSEASLLHAASYALSLTEYFAQQPLPLEASSDHVYFNLTPQHFMHYPVWGTYALAVLVLILFINLVRLQGRYSTKTATGKNQQGKNASIGVKRLMGGFFVVLLQLLLFLMFGNGLNALIGGGLNAYFVGAESFFQLLSEDRAILLGLALVIIAMQWVFVGLIVSGTRFPSLAIFIGVILAVSVFENALLPSLAMLLVGIIALVLYLKMFGKNKIQVERENQAAQAQAQIRQTTLTFGYLSMWLLLSLLCAVLLPLMAHIFLWPLLFSVIGLSVATIKAPAGNVLASKTLPSLCIFLGAAPAIYWWGSYIFSLFSSIGHLAPGLPLLFVALVAGLLTPLIASLLIDAQAHTELADDVTTRSGVSSVKNALPPLSFAIVGAAVLVITLTLHQFDSEHKKPNELFYLADFNQSNQEKWQWASLDVALDDWTRQVFHEDQKQSNDDAAANANRIYPIVDKRMFVSDAPKTELQPLSVENLSREIQGENQHVRFTLVPSNKSAGQADYSDNQHSQHHAPLEKLNIFVKDPENLVAVKVNGETLENANQATAQVASLTESWGHWQYFGLPPSGAQFELVLNAEQALTLRFVEVRLGLPEAVKTMISPRPDAMMARSYSLASDSFSDTTVVVSELRYSAADKWSASSVKVSE